MWARRAVFLLLAFLALALLGSSPGNGDPSAAAPSILTSGPPSFVNVTATSGPGLATVAAAAAFGDLDAQNLTWQVDWALTSTSGTAVNVSPNVSVVAGTNASAWAALTAALPQDEWQLTWIARDPAGTEVTASVTFRVDLTAPRVEITAPGLVNYSAVTVRLDASDAESGIAAGSLTFLVRSACSPNWLREYPPVTHLPGRLVAEATLALCPGRNSFQANLADTAGNGWSSGVRDILVDLAPPSFALFEPGPFDTVAAGTVTLRVNISDDVAGVLVTSVEAQVSTDGGITWGPWTAAETYGSKNGVVASVTALLPDGALGAVKWRAADLAGNGPNTTRVQFFYTNGPPFLVKVEPPEGGVFYEHDAIAFRAEFADPDGDGVVITWSTPQLGDFGRVFPVNSTRYELPPTVRRALPLGVHNITVMGDDLHGHRVSYTYQVEIVPRPPPDLRAFVIAGAIAVLMVLSAWHVWKEEVERAQPPPST